MKQHSIDHNNSRTEDSTIGGFCLSGRVEKTSTWTRQDLLAMEVVEANDILLACGSGEPKGRISQCRGVLLADIINSAKVIVSDHNDTKKMFVVASATDGYTTVFSWQEIFNTSVGAGIMIMLEKDGKPVYEGRGSMDLFSVGDFLTGPRYVKRLANLDIRMLG
ncbi:MAG: hypothetical protein KKD01_16285 [Proteobacteria bacterium]|nr:hypothetical protein [Pseudomonadota bacterium]MBU1456283.1 hypothetical protein [Pseudomonadota bacterium]